MANYKDSIKTTKKRSAMDALLGTEPQQETNTPQPVVQTQPEATLTAQPQAEPVVPEVTTPVSEPETTVVEAEATTEEAETEKVSKPRGPKKKGNKKTKSFNIEDEMYEAIERHCQENEVSVSVFARKAFQEYMDKLGIVWK